MLSRVAERIYWGARYLERVENIARLVSVYDSLLFDLPKKTNISWYNLIRINSDAEKFSERYTVQDERNVVKFLLADDTNPGSLLSSLKQAKENIRTTRDVVPKETWEQINELDLFARENIQQGINRTHRHEFLNSLIERCQQITGLFEGSMCRDATWQFVILGRNIERADMTTRILDAGVSVMVQPNEGTRANISQIVWGNVLRSVSGYMNYRRGVRTAIQPKKVARFLIEDTYFPRTLRFCIDEMASAAKKLPRPGNVLKGIEAVQALHYPLNNGKELDENFQNYLNDMQIRVSALHNEFSENWFAFSTSPQVQVVKDSSVTHIQLARQG